MKLKSKWAVDLPRIVRIILGIAMLPVATAMLKSGHGETAAIWAVVGMSLIFM
jgi:hypothetical protein